jgi:hypothetical protein
MTIAELSAMLGVPIDTLYAGVIAVKALGATASAATFAIAAPASRPGLRSRPTAVIPHGSRRVAHIERRRIRQPDESGRVRVITRYGCAIATRAEGSTAKPRCDWSMPSVVRLRLRSLRPEGPGVTHAVEKCVLRRRPTLSFPIASAPCSTVKPLPLSSRQPSSTHFPRALVAVLDELAPAGRRSA